MSKEKNIYLLRDIDFPFSFGVFWIITKSNMYFYEKGTNRQTKNWVLKKNSAHISQNNHRYLKELLTGFFVSSEITLTRAIYPMPVPEFIV